MLLNTLYVRIETFWGPGKSLKTNCHLHKERVSFGFHFSAKGNTKSINTKTSV